MLVSDIQTRVNRAFGDESGAQIDLTDILRWVNDGQLEIALQKQLLQVVSTVTVTVNVGIYTLPTNILQLRSVRYDGTVLDPMTMAQSEELIPSYDVGVSVIGSGVPTSYWIWGSPQQVYLYPLPNNSTSVLKLYYTRIPIQVTVAGDTPELPVQYHPRIVDYCLAKAYELDANPQGQQMKMNELVSGLARTDMDLWQPQEVYPSVTVAMDDAGMWY